MTTRTPRRRVRWALVLLALAAPVLTGTAHAADAWKTTLDRELPLMGYHNWIVIADAAYPWQTEPGIEVVSTGAGQLNVLRAVLEGLGKARHVQPVIYSDSELQYVSAKDAPTVTAYRGELAKLLGPRAMQTRLHQQLLDGVAAAGHQFHVLVLKTSSTLPYSSVFVELNAAYWNSSAEASLRAAMPAANAGAGPGARPQPGFGPMFGPGPGDDGMGRPPWRRPRGRRGG